MKHNISFLILTSFFMLACESGFHSRTQSLNDLAKEALVPATDKLDARCASSDLYDACIFQKNPVFQEGRSFSENEDLTSLKKYGVKLTGLDGSGFLSNSYFRVQLHQGENFSLKDLENSKSSASDSVTAQLMSYYWLQRSIEYMQNRTGEVALEGKKISILVGDSVSGFSSLKNSIHLRGLKNAHPMAFDASVMIYFLGEANAHFASRGELSSEDSEHHKLCKQDPKGCCKTHRGCARALLAGSGDYWAAVMFPDSPVMGEGLANSVKGLKLCGHIRSVEDLSAMSAQKAYGLCASSQGDAHLLGAFYASLWWKVRKQVSENEKKNIDKLHLLHLKKLKASSTFDDALQAIREEDQNVFSSRYTSLFETEFSQHGL